MPRFLRAKKHRQNLEAIGGYKNDMQAVYAGAVRQIIEDLEDAEQLLRDCLMLTEWTKHGCVCDELKKLFKPTELTGPKGN